MTANQNSPAARILTARVALFEAEADLTALEAGLDVDYPLQDEDDSAFDAWNDAYENAREARGGFAIDDRIRDAKTELLRATRDGLASKANEAGQAEIDALAIAFGAALGDTRPYNYRAQQKCLELAIRLDVDTL